MLSYESAQEIVGVQIARLKTAHRVSHTVIRAGRGAYPTIQPPP